MKKDKKNNLSEEHLRKIMHRVDYEINESPRYRPLVTDGEEFDEVPNTNPNATLDGQPSAGGQNLTFMEAGEQQPPERQGSVPPEPSNDQPVGMGDAPAEPVPDAPVPAFDDTGGTEQIDAMPDAGMGTPNPEQQVDELQNEIIKHNTEAMKSIHDQLEGLGAVVQGLNSKLDQLGAEVEEVREPTNAEKLMNKTDVSYPYYFNLNDFWKGNWFDERNGGGAETEQGIKELPDGTFIADFDDLPQKSKIDVQNSFNV